VSIELLHHELQLTKAPVLVINDENLLEGRNFLGHVVLVSKKIKEIPLELRPFVDWICETTPALSSQGIQPAAQAPPAPALFLDRDGIINLDHGYVGDPSQVVLMPGIARLVAKANHHKRQVVVVTNQSGIGRGYYPETGYHAVMKCLADLLKKEQAHFDHIEFAPYHPEAKEEKYRLHRYLRKPRPGMLLQAAQKKGLDLAQSIMIGDRATDLMAAVVAGVGEIFLYQSEQTDQEWRIFHEWLAILEANYGLKNLLAGRTVKTIADFAEVKP
jgi:D-glycero-D-manno-heptose 1,7-bisphosphate phosphatase